MSLFSTNWRTQVTKLLPSLLRSTSLIDYITALISTVQTRSNEFASFDIDSRKRAKFNSQIIVLRAALNDIFGVTASPFILVQPVLSAGANSFVYNLAEAQPKYVYNAAEGETPGYIFNDGELQGSSFNFTVLIPSTIYTAELERQVRNEVEIYRLAGMTFNIIQYTP